MPCWAIQFFVSVKAHFGLVRLASSSASPTVSWNTFHHQKWNKRTASGGTRSSDKAPACVHQWTLVRRFARWVGKSSSLAVRPMPYALYPVGPLAGELSCALVSIPRFFFDTIICMYTGFSVQQANRISFRWNPSFKQFSHNNIN